METDAGLSARTRKPGSVAALPASSHHTASWPFHLHHRPCPQEMGFPRSKEQTHSVSSEGGIDAGTPVPSSLLSHSDSLVEVLVA